MPSMIVPDACPSCGQFEGAFTDHLCVPRDPDRCPLHIVESHQRFDVAMRRASDMAASLARNDHDRTARGDPCSGVRSIIVGWDVWEIRHDSPTPIVHAITPEIDRRYLVSIALDILRHHEREDRIT